VFDLAGRQSEYWYSGRVKGTGEGAARIKWDMGVQLAKRVDAN